MLSAVLCLSLLAGCGSGKSTGTASEASGSTETAETANAAESGELRELDVVLDWYPNALHAFLYEAIDKGYYAEEGLKVNIRFPSNTNDALSLVAAGKADIGLYYQHDVIQARANQNVPVKSIGAAIGEWLGAQSGLGYFSRRMMTQLDGAGVFAPIVLLSVVAMLMVAVVGLIENKVVKWRGES